MVRLETLRRPVSGLFSVRERARVSFCRLVQTAICSPAIPELEFGVSASSLAALSFKFVQLSNYFNAGVEEYQLRAEWHVYACAPLSRENTLAFTWGFGKLDLSLGLIRPRSTAKRHLMVSFQAI